MQVKPIFHQPKNLEVKTGIETIAAILIQNILNKIKPYALQDQNE